MKLNERLFELRRKAGLSQEELAERVGVSRQAVGKWENGTSVPELEKLLALAEFYGLPIGELLGVETPAAPAAETPAAASGETDGGVLEELLRGLTESQRAAEELARRQRRRLWVALGAMGTAVAVVLTILGFRISDLGDRLRSLDARAAVSDSRLSNQIYALQNSLREMLAEQNSLFSGWSTETLAFDPESRELTVRLFVQPKSVTEGTRLDFIVTDEDGNELEAAAERQGTGFAAEIRLPQSGRESLLEAIYADKSAGVGVSSQVKLPDPMDGGFALAAVLTEGDTSMREELGTFYTGISDLAGSYRSAWYPDPTAADTAGLLAVYADDGREVVSAELVTYLNGMEWARAPLNMTGGWVTEFPMPEKYLVPRQEGGAVASVPSSLTAVAERRLFVRELTPDVPESREGDTVTVLLELTDDRCITYGAVLFTASGPALPRNAAGDMTPILK